MKTYTHRTSLSGRHLLFAIHSLQKKHGRAAHFSELMVYLSCGKDMLTNGIWAAWDSIRTTDWQWLVISDADYIPMGPASDVRRRRCLRLPVKKDISEQWGYDGNNADRL